MKRWIVLGVLVGFIAVFWLVTSSAIWAFDLSPEEQKMFDLVNREREIRGLSPLKLDSVLTELARKHSREMIDFNYFAHESPVSGGLLQRILAFRVENWLIAGENLAGAPTVEIAHNALMKSEKHRDNILRGEYTHLGVGIVDGGPYGKMFTQEFIAYRAGYSPNATGSIYGRIVDFRGQPIAGAAVRINKTVIPTNAFGEFRFTLVQPGIYTIYYDAAGFISQIQEYITVNAGTTTTTPRVIMSKNGESSLLTAQSSSSSSIVAAEIRKNALKGRYRIRRKR